MAVPEETRHLLSRWCADRVPHREREHRQISYMIQGEEITIQDRRPPVYPELDTAWSTTPIARLRLEDRESGRWALYRRARGNDAWLRDEKPGANPLDLLERLRT